MRRQPAERCKASRFEKIASGPLIKVICSQGEEQYFLQNERSKPLDFLFAKGKIIGFRM